MRSARTGRIIKFVAHSPRALHSKHCLSLGAPYVDHGYLTPLTQLPSGLRAMVNPKGRCFRRSFDPSQYGKWFQDAPVRTRLRRNGGFWSRATSKEPRASSSWSADLTARLLGGTYLLAYPIKRRPRFQAAKYIPDPEPHIVLCPLPPPHTPPLPSPVKLPSFSDIGVTLGDFYHSSRSHHFCEDLCGPYLVASVNNGITDLQT